MGHMSEFHSNYNHIRPFVDFSTPGGYRGNSGWQTTEFGYSDGNMFFNSVMSGRPTGFQRGCSEFMGDVAALDGACRFALGFLNMLSGEDRGPSYPPADYPGYYQGAPGGFYPNSAFGYGPAGGYNYNGYQTMPNGYNPVLNDINPNGMSDWPSRHTMPEFGFSNPWANQQYGAFGAGNNQAPDQDGLHVVGQSKDSDGNIVLSYADRNNKPVRQVVCYPFGSSEGIPIQRTEYINDTSTLTAAEYYRASVIRGTKYHEGEKPVEVNGQIRKTYTDGGKTYEEYVDTTTKKLMRVTVDNGNRSNPTDISSEYTPGKPIWTKTDKEGHILKQDGTPQNPQAASGTPAAPGAPGASGTPAAPAPGTPVAPVPKAAAPAPGTPVAPAPKAAAPVPGTPVAPAQAQDEKDVAKLVALQIKYDNAKATGSYSEATQLADQLGQLKSKLGLFKTDKGNQHIASIKNPEYQRLVKIAKLQGLYDAVESFSPADGNKYYYWCKEPVTDANGNVIPGMTHKQQLADMLGGLKANAGNIPNHTDVKWSMPDANSVAAQRAQMINENRDLSAKAAKVDQALCQMLNANDSGLMSHDLKGFLESHSTTDTAVSEIKSETNYNNLSPETQAIVDNLLKERKALQERLSQLYKQAKDASLDLNTSGDVPPDVPTPH